MHHDVRSLHPHLQPYAAGQTAMSDTVPAADAVVAAAPAAVASGGVEAAGVAPPLLVEVHLDEGRYPSLKVSSAYGGGSSSDGRSSSGSRSSSSGGAGPHGNVSHTQRHRNSSIRVLHGCQVRACMGYLAFNTGSNNTL